LTNTDNLNPIKPSLVELLQQACDGLLFMSESEYPLEVFTWQIEENNPVNIESIIKKTGHPTQTSVGVIDLDTFFAQAIEENDWYSPEEIEVAKKFQHLVKIIKNNLIDVVVYRLGEVEIDVYILGKASNSEYVGIMTQVVET
jgi:hypothetical protein